jgi:8-oxo-dGTP diphosphatase
MTRPIAIAVVEREGSFLIGLRPEGVPLAGYWEFPGGKIEPGETPAEAACRECREETGLDVTPLDVLMTEVFAYPHDRVELIFVRCAGTGTSPEPLPPYRWVPRADLAAYRFPEGNRRLLAQLTAGDLPANRSR